MSTGLEVSLCQFCGKPNSPGATFCSICGTRLCAQGSESDGDVIFQLPSQFEIPDVPGPQFAPGVTIRSTSITVGSNTYSLAGATRVSYEQTQLRAAPREFWIGWGVILLGLLLVIPLNIIAVAMAVVGIFMVRMSGKNGSYTTLIFLHSPAGRQLIYKDNIGRGGIDKVNERRWNFMIRRARQIAEVLGEQVQK